MRKAIDIKPLDNYRIWLKFDDGPQGEIDLSDFWQDAVSLRLGPTQTGCVDPSVGVGESHASPARPLTICSIFIAAEYTRRTMGPPSRTVSEFVRSRDCSLQTSDFGPI
jgi:hypothetical protein